MDIEFSFLDSSNSMKIRKAVWELGKELQMFNYCHIKNEKLKIEDVIKGLDQLYFNSDRKYSYQIKV